MSCTSCSSWGHHMTRPYASCCELQVLDEIRRDQPWYDRHGGRDHMFVFTADNGCGPARCSCCLALLARSPR